MRIGRFLSPQSLKFFVVEEGLHPKIVVHSKSLELLCQGKVCEDHVMDLSRYKSVFVKEDQICYNIPVVLTGNHLQTSLGKA